MANSIAQNIRDKKKAHYADGSDDTVQPDDMDPQSAVAAQGLKTLGQAAYNSEPVQNIVTGKGLDDYNDVLNRAIVDAPGARQELAQRSLGTAMGTVKAPSELPMDEASRMARAEKMGFDTSKTYYHGTKSTFDKFDPGKSQTEAASFFTQDPEFANKFSGDAAKQGENPQTLPVHLKANNTFDYDNSSHVNDVVKRLSKDDYESIADDFPMVNGKPFSKKDVKQAIGLGQWSILERPEVFNAIKDAGYDSAHVYENGEKNIAVFQPNQIRSKFAEFDPKQKKSGKISYADGGEVDAPQTPEQPQQQAPVPEVAPTDETHVVNQWGEVGTLPSEDVHGATTEGGYTLATPDQINDYKLQKTYGNPVEQLKAGAEGFAQGVAGPLAPMAEKYLGAKDEDIRGRAEANPGTHFTGEVAGLIAPAFLPGGTAAGIGGLSQAGLLEKAGKATMGLIGSPTTLSGKIGAAAAKSAIENMLLSGSDETSKMILNDPEASGEHAIASIGLSGVLGGAIGGSLGAISPLLKGPLSKLGQEIENFKGRIAEHSNVPDPVKTMGDELTSYLGETNKVAGETFGNAGIKAEAISKLMPEMTDSIASQANGISDQLDSSLQKLGERKDPHTGLLQDKVNTFKQALNSQDPATIFDGIQTLKQQLQAESRYTEGVSPLNERLYRSTVKDLAYKLKNSLEDNTVWGKAADVQASVNGAASKYIAATKDFKGLMTTKVMGEPTIDPGKIQTYLNQLGKANAEIKQTKLQNFLDHGDEFKAAVSKAYESIGAESPIQNTPMNYTLSTLGKKTAGSKLADLFIKKGLTDVGGKVLGGAIGGGLGHLVGGHGAIGTLLGQQALGPFFSSVLPGIAKAIVDKPSSALGFKAAADHGLAVAKSEALLSRVAKSVFKVGSEAASSSVAPDMPARSKLDKVLRAVKQSPAALLNNVSQTGHYLPAHAQAMSQTSMVAANYLNSLRPDTQPKNPLDPKPVVSSTQQAAYNSALDIANNPTSILGKIKSGSLTPGDMKTLQTVYPAMYSSMKNKLMSEIIDSTAKNKIIPYKTKVALSLFLGQPLDSTMTPSSIQSIQATTQSGKQNAQDQQAASPAPKRSTSSLSKLPGMYKTPGQTADGRRTKDE